MPFNFFFYIFTISIVLIFSTCKKDELVVQEDLPSLSGDTIQIEGFFVLPTNINQISNLRLISGFHEGELQLQQTTSEITSGSYSITLYEDAVQLLILLNGESPLAYALINTKNHNQITIDKKSTANALLMGHPLLIDYDTGAFSEMLDQIKTHSLYDQYSTEIESRMNSGQLLIDENIESFGIIVSDLVANRFDPEDYTQEGIEFLPLPNAGQDFAFEVRNKRKRWLSIYAEMKAENESSFMEKQLMIGTDLEKEDFYLLESAQRFKWWYGFIADLISVADSPRLQVDNSTNYNEVLVSCYGIGVEGFADLSSEELDKALDAIIQSVLLDFIAPMVEGAFGISKNKFRGELRGRPRNDSKAEFVRILKQEFLKSSTIESLKFYAGNDEIYNFWTLIYSTTKDVLLNENNFRLIKNILRDYFKNEFAYITSKDLLPWLKVMDLVDNTVQISRFLGAVIFSKAKTEFIHSKTSDDGTFTVYPIPLGNIGSASDLAASSDGSEVWVTDGFNIYYLNDGTSEFDKMSFYHDFFLMNGGTPTAAGGIFSIDVSPLTSEPYFQFTVLNGVATGIKDKIYKYTSSGNFELVYETPDIGQNIDAIAFDIDGNLWFQVWQEVGVDDSFSAITVIKENGEVTYFDNDLLDSYLVGGINGTGTSDYSFSLNGLPLAVNSSRDKLFELQTDGTLDEIYTLSNFDEKIEYAYNPNIDELILVNSVSGQTRLSMINLSSLDVTSFDTFNQFTPEFANQIRHLEQDQNNKLWFSFHLQENSIWFLSVDRNSFLELTTNSYNLPSQVDPNMIHSIKDIDRGQDGPLWFIMGDRFVVKSNI